MNLGGGRGTGEGFGGRALHDHAADITREEIPGIVSHHAEESVLARAHGGAGVAAPARHGSGVGGAPGLSVRALLTFLGAWIATGGVVAALDPPAAPGWTPVVGGLGAAFLAVAVVALEDTLAEDALKGIIFSFLGGSLLLMGLPAWVGWPLVVGPWVGFVGGRRRGGWERRP